MRLASLAIVAATVTAAFASGCGNTCITACTRVYQPGDGTGGGTCGIEQANSTAEDAISGCVVECERAMNRTGELGGYNPYEPSGETIFELENERQAALWVDCVDEIACEGLVRGQCPGGGSR